MTIQNIYISLEYVWIWKKVLVEEGGADNEKQDADGITASGRAQMEGFEDIVEYLKVRVPESQ